MQYSYISHREVTEWEHQLEKHQVAVLLPCFNEAITIEKVVRDFQAILPTAIIYVFDNNSTDNSAALAAAAGAVVVKAPKQGKGNVVRKMFNEVEADLYLMCDSDDTYPAELAPNLIKAAIHTHADMVVGSRLSSPKTQSFRRFHKLGNIVLTQLISRLFHTRISDIFSGYRVFSRNFVKTIPVMSEGFEVETEMTLQALAKGFQIVEVPIEYRNRPKGSFSKLNTWSDGYLCLKVIFMLYKNYKPLTFFSIISLVFLILSLAIGIPPIIDYVTTHYVSKVPSAILATGCALISVFSFGIGLVLDTIARYQRENYELFQKILGAQSKPKL